MLSKKHYKAISNIIAQCTLEGEQLLDKGELVLRLGDYFATDNPNFNFKAWVSACNEDMS